MGTDFGFALEVAISVLRNCLMWTVVIMGVAFCIFIVGGIFFIAAQAINDVIIQPCKEKWRKRK